MNRSTRASEASVTPSGRKKIMSTARGTLTMGAMAVLITTSILSLRGLPSEAAYGVPQWIKEKAWEYLDEPLRDVLRRWRVELSQRSAF